MITKKRVKVELDADVYLEGDLYLPGTEEKLPTLLFRTPYGKEVSQTYFLIHHNGLQIRATQF